jgi:glycosyltransferase involved in cell wall biosynthesis
MSKRVRIAVTGLPFFGTRVALTLREAGLAAYFIPTLREAVREPRNLRRMAKADLVYAIGPSIEKRSPLAMLSLLRKRIVIHWVGSDVEYAIEAWRHGKSSERLIHDATHWADASWLAEEIRPIGVQAEERPLPMPIAFGVPAPMPEEHGVLISLPREPHSAYDVEGTLEVVAALPGVRFSLVGGYEPPVSLPNLSNLGFVDGMASVYRDHSVFLRLMRHDALSHSVVEALSFGRRVVWSYPLPGVDQASGVEDAISALQRITNSQPALNEAGLATAERYRPGVIIPDAVAALTRLAQ